MSTFQLVESLELNGLSLAPPQVLGGVRLVPLLRNKPSEDLRLAKREYGDDISLVSVDHRKVYCSYVPHGLVADWTNDGTSVSQAAYGGQLFGTKNESTKDGKRIDFGFATARVMSKMRRRENKTRMRFLPLHVAMEGFLSLHFGGPAFAWEEYSRTAMRDGLSPRIEQTYDGTWINGLEDALRVFEIHTSQVGVLVFVGDELASAFVVPHYEDYEQLHGTLLTDFYGEFIYWSGLRAEEYVYHPESINPADVHTFDDLRSQLSGLTERWSDLHELMTGRLFDCPIRSERVYHLGPFEMQRFVSNLEPKGENHIGEMIVRDDGSIEYLKTFRLSATQCRRAYLLMILAECDWELDRCAERLNCSKHQLVYRLENAGFGYLLHQHVLDAARSARRKDRD